MKKFFIQKLSIFTILMFGIMTVSLSGAPIKNQNGLAHWADIGELNPSIFSGKFLYISENENHIVETFNFFSCGYENFGGADNGAISYNMTMFIMADDFEVPANSQMSITQVTFETANNIGLATYLGIYTDDNGSPGAQVALFTNLTPTSQELNGTTGNDNRYKITVDLPEAVEVFGGPDGSIYWMGYGVSQGTEDNYIRPIKADTVTNSSTWWNIPGDDTWYPENNYQSDFIFEVIGDCSSDGVGCEVPTELEVLSVSDTEATIGWTAADPIPSNGYDYYYTTENIMPGGGTVPDGNVPSGTDSITISDLEPATSYYVWIRSNCGNGSYSYWVSVSLTTTITIDYPDYACYQGDGIFVPGEDLGTPIPLGTINDHIRAAVPLVVEFGNDFELKEISFDISMSATQVETASIIIKDDDDGVPGEVIKSYEIAPTEMIYTGLSNSKNTYHLVFTLPESVVLTGGQNYWLEPAVDTGSNTIAYWTMTSGGSHPGFPMRSNDSGETWIDLKEYLYLEYDIRAIFFAAGDCIVNNGYCIPEAIDPNHFISKFSTTGGTINIDNQSDGFSEGGYGDFYNQHAVRAEQNFSVNFEANISGSPSGFRIWVDWNQDGEFDTTEEVAWNSTELKNNHSGTIAVPSDAVVGETRMRIASNSQSSIGDTDPCAEGFSYGEFEDYKFIVVAYGGNVFDCEQDYYLAGGNPLDYPTGPGFTGGHIAANDVILGPNMSFSPQTLTFDMILYSGEPTEFTLQIYEDNGTGGVGAAIGSLYTFTPSNYTATYRGQWNGYYPQYKIEADLSSFEIFLGNDTEETQYYWFGIASQLSSTGVQTFLASYNYVEGASYPQWQYQPGTGWVEQGSGSPTEGGMMVEGICGEYYGEQPGEDFPAPYCEVATITYAEAITRVIFADIDNSSAVHSVTEHEDFTHIVGHVETGVTYPIAVEGNTYGEWLSYITVWIDWNQDEEFDETTERYDIGTLFDTNGQDGQQAVADIEVPADALLGNTRMRVMKSYYYSPPSACDGMTLFGQTEDYTIHVSLGEEEEPGCKQEYFLPGVDPLNYPVGVGISGGRKAANDFIVDPNSSFELKTITFDMLLLSGVPTDLTLQFNADNGNGGVGNEIGSEIVFQQGEYVPTYIGHWNDLYPLYKIKLDVSSNDIIFENGSDNPKPIWISIESGLSSTGDFIYWNSYEYQGGPSSPEWQYLIGEGWFEYGDGEPVEGSMTVRGTCDEYIGEDFPAPYCEVSGNDNVEAITRVVFADIDNSSAPDSNEKHEDFTHIVGHVETGTDYAFAAEGNTDGEWTNYFTVWIDWNQDGEFDETTERYDIGSIFNSDGTDGQQAVSNIEVPVNALIGDTRMRVIKSFGGLPTDACNSGSLYGQAEDYTINVTVGEDEPDCSQGIPSFDDIPNAYNIESSTAFHTAEDFTVEEGIIFEMSRITIDTNQQELPDYIEINIREDSNGKPGDILETLSFDESGYTWEIVGNAFGDPIYHMTFDLNTPLEFEEGTYWMDPQMSTPNGETVWWAATDEAAHGALPQRSEDDGSSWEEDVNGLNMIFTVSGHCVSAGLNEISDFDFSYYPNPVKDVLYINSSQKVESVKVYNLAGQEVMKQIGYLSTANQIDVTTLPNGVYLIRVVLERGQIETFKVIKKH